MKKTAVFYGSTTGNCESVASRIAKAMGIASADVYNVSELSPSLLKEYDAFLFGSSTWGEGELQDDWYEGVEKLKKATLKDKVVALFGCGNAKYHTNTFCGALSHLYDAVKDSGCKLVGCTPTSDYSFTHSDSVVDGKFVGLPLDEDNEPEKTDGRIASWVKVIGKDFE